MGKISKIMDSPFTWLSFQEIFSFIINYSLVIIFAKLLSPESFGEVALLNLYTGFFGIISGLGINKLIVRDEIRNNIRLSALFTANILVSLCIFFLALSFLCLFIWLYFDNDQSFFYLGILSLLSIFTGSLYSFSTSLYIRDKKFVKMAKIMIGSYLISFIIVLFIAFYNRKTESLLFKQIVVGVIPVISLLSFSNFKLSLVFSKPVFRHFFHFSKYITLNNLFNYLVRNVDYIILGHFFSKSIVGEYSIAYKVLVTPVKMITKQIDSVSFPGLVGLKDDLKGFKILYHSSIRLITQTVFPGVIAMILFSPMVVDIFFDKRYLHLAGLISILSLSALFQSVTSLAGNLFIIGNETRRMFKLTLIKFGLLAVFLLVGGFSNNIYYFSWSYVIAFMVTNFPLTNYYALRPFKISILSVLKEMLLPGFVSLLLLGVIYLTDRVLNFSPVLKIGLITITLVFIYLSVNEKIQQLLGIKNVWNSWRIYLRANRKS